MDRLANEPFGPDAASGANSTVEAFASAVSWGAIRQRQRFPLINSRTSAQVLAWPSLISPKAEQICPGVQ